MKKKAIKPKEENILEDKHDRISRSNIGEYLKSNQSGTYMTKDSYDMGQKGITVMKATFQDDVQDHRHDFYEIQYVEKGQSIQFINKEKVVLKEGSLCIFNKDTLHGLTKTDEDTRIIHIGLDDTIFEHAFFKNTGLTENIATDYIYRSQFGSGQAKDYIQIDDLGEDIGEIINLIYYEYTVKAVGYDNMMYAYIIILLNKLHRYYLAGSHERRRGNTRKELLFISLLDFIEENSASVTLKDASDHLHLHPNYLSGMIKDLSGKNFTGIVQDIRLKKAADLLQMTDDCINAISLKVGYENTNYFYKIFKRKYKMTPKTFRYETRK